MPENAQPVATLIAKLADKNGIVRQQAREDLIASGTVAVPALVNTLSSEKKILRWEAAKALAALDAPAAIPALIETLRDHDPGIRWVAGDALLRQGRQAIEPLLQAIIDDTDPIREGAFHVIHHLAHHQLAYRDALMPVVDALQTLDADVATSLVASQAIDALAARQ